MKRLTALILALLLGFSAIPGVSAQSSETIWMETSQQSYGDNETIIVTLNAITATAIQGFTFQLRYDPGCLQPAAPTSLLSGLNYMSVPQTTGLVDAIFASTTPLKANGALAQIQFKALTGCQTVIKLETATLAVLDSSGMAVSLQGIHIRPGSLALSVGGAAAPQPTSVLETRPTPAAEIEPTSVIIPTSIGQFNWLSEPMGILLALLLILGLIVVLAFLVRALLQPSGSAPAVKRSTAALLIKRGPRAGTTLPLVRFPCRIGSNPENEISLSDARISPVHAEIFASENSYYLVDLGSRDGTYLNGKLIHNQTVPVKRGDVLRLGGVLLIFGQV